MNSKSEEKNLKKIERQHYRESDYTVREYVLILYLYVSHIYHHISLQVHAHRKKECATL